LTAHNRELIRGQVRTQRKVREWSRDQRQIGLLF